ncbi:MAG: class I SAM-dependent methyltransferase, partial [Thermodesulfobacteriota bacterium]|nr:class I SAM-dependent methyltransferase [Thermodesulfobacteriota bacterium]
MDHVLTEDAMIRKLTRDSKNFPFSIDPALAEYLYQLVRETNPSLVVEIGCYIGFSTLHISKALKENNCGRLVSFDMDASRARDNIRQAGLSDWVEFIEGDSSVMLGQYLRDLKGEKIDFVFVDGDHTRRGCVRDFNALHGQIEEGGYLLFHDICPRIWEWKGPRLVLDYLEAAKSRPSFDQFDIVERTDLDDFGAAVCRLISSGKNPLAEGPWHRQFRLGINTSIVAGWLEKFVFNRAYAAIFDGRPPFLWKFVYAALKFFKGISINNRAERLWEFDFPHLKGRIIPNSIDFSWKDSPL